MCTYEYLLATVNYVQNAVVVKSDRILMAPACKDNCLHSGVRGLVVFMEEVNMPTTLTSLYIKVLAVDTGSKPKQCR